MCSISGLISPKPTTKHVKMLINTIRRAEERGRDGFGIVTPTQAYRFLTRPTETKLRGIKPESVMLNNNRAEPTTEFVARKTLKDVQPFFRNNVIVAHNGTIANDKELMAEFNIVPETYIDSGVIAPLVARVGVHEAVQRLVGSYAMAIYVNGLVYLVCNYKPIFIKRLKDAFLFSSMDEYLREDWMDNIVQLPPYSITMIDPASLALDTYSLRPEKSRKDVLVICSGGLDSMVTATKYVRDGANVTLLHFTYGCRAEKQEVEAVINIAHDLGCSYKFIDMSSIFRSEIGGSPLLSDTASLMKERAGERSAELAHEWVPARNVVFYSVALAYAEAHDFDIVALGNNLEESGAYPDNEMIFAKKFNDLIPNAVNLGVDIVVEQPVGNLMKHEIVALGAELNAPFIHSWSCYENGDKHCGQCGPCYMRKKAFEMNGLKDPVFDE